MAELVQNSNESDEWQLAMLLYKFAIIRRGMEAVNGRGQHTGP